MSSQFSKAFALFDGNGDGIISRTELASVLQLLDSEMWTNDRVDTLLGYADVNRDGQLDIEEFLEWVGNGKEFLRRDEEDLSSEDDDAEAYLPHVLYTKAMVSQLGDELARQAAADGSVHGAATSVRLLALPHGAAEKDARSVELLLKNYSWEDSDLPEGATRKGALRWLRGALCKWSDGDKRYKDPCKWLIANRRLWGSRKRRRDPKDPGFNSLKELAFEHLDSIGVRFETTVFLSLNLAGQLGHLGSGLPPSRPRQDDHLSVSRSLLSLGHTGGDGNTSWNYALLLLSAAHAVDFHFKELAQRICETAGGEFRGPAPKGLMRILAKLDTDHAEACEPKSAENIDTNRVAWTFSEPPQLCKAFEAAQAMFGAPLRVKNGYSSDFNALEQSKGYRNILANYLYEKHGVTWGMLAKELTTSNAWRQFRDDLADQFKCVSNSALRDLPIEFKEYTRAADFWMHALQSGELSNMTVKLVVEVQYMLKPYMDMRKETHFWYKMARAEHAESLQLDFMALCKSS